MKTAILVILSILLLCTACVQVTTTPDSEETNCNKPYIQVGDDCCLDKDDNSICDKDEMTEEESTNEETDEETVEESEKSVEEKESSDDEETADDSDEVTEENLGTIESCSKPFIESGTGCCLDVNEDGACDTVSEDAGSCGDGMCENGEDCCADCGCPAREICSDNECSPEESFSNEELQSVFEMKPMVFAPRCGDGACNGDETQASCCSDCGCSGNDVCLSDGCGELTLTPFFAPMEMVVPGQVASDDLSMSTYIVVVLESMRTKVNGDQPGQDGELMFFSEIDTGDEVQRVKWPNSFWKTTGDNMQLLGDEIEAVPLFAYREEWMGDELAIKMMASDNDIRSAMPFIDGSVPTDEVETYFSASTCSSKYKNLVYIPGLSETLGTAGQFVRDLFGGEDCKENDMFGTVTTTFSAANDWGAGQTYTVELDKIEYVYSIKKVTVPTDVGIEVKLKEVEIIKDGDSGSNKGEIVVHARAAESIVDGSYGIGPDTLDQGVAGWKPGRKSDGETIAFDKVLYADDSVEPFLYIEVDVFDLDSDREEAEAYSMFPGYLTKDADELGIGSYLFLLDDEELMEGKESTKVITLDKTESAIGEARIKLEITRKPY